MSKESSLVELVLDIIQYMHLFPGSIMGTGNFWPLGLSCSRLGLACGISTTCSAPTLGLLDRT